MLFKELDYGSIFTFIITCYSEIQVCNNIPRCVAIIIYL